MQGGHTVSPTRPGGAERHRSLQTDGQQHHVGSHPLSLVSGSVASYADTASPTGWGPWSPARRTGATQRARCASFLTEWAGTAHGRQRMFLVGDSDSSSSVVKEQAVSSPPSLFRLCGDTPPPSSGQYKPSAACWPGLTLWLGPSRPRAQQICQQQRQWTPRWIPGGWWARKRVPWSLSLWMARPPFR